MLRIPRLSKDLTDAAKTEFPGPQSGMFSLWMDAVRAGVAGLGGALVRTDRFTVLPGQTAFVLSRTPAPATVLVFVNGQRQIPLFDFVVAGSLVTWLPVSFALEPGDNVLISYQEG